jgi:hypothetical protein
MASIGYEQKQFNMVRLYVSLTAKQRNYIFRIYGIHMHAKPSIGKKWVQIPTRLSKEKQKLTHFSPPYCERHYDPGKISTLFPNWLSELLSNSAKYILEKFFEDGSNWCNIMSCYSMYFVVPH